MHKHTPIHTDTEREREIQIPNSQHWKMLLEQAELVDSRRPPAVSGAWDTQRESDRWREERKKRKRKHEIEKEKWWEATTWGWEHPWSILSLSCCSQTSSKQTTAKPLFRPGMDHRDRPHLKPARIEVCSSSVWGSIEDSGSQMLGWYL